MAALGASLAASLYKGTFVWVIEVQGTMLAFSCVLMVMTFPALGVYQSWRGKSLHELLLRVALAWLLVESAGVLLTFSIHRADTLSRLWLGYWAMFTIVLLVVSKTLVYSGLKLLRREGFNQRTVAIVGSAPYAHFLIDQMRSRPEAGFSPVMVFDLPTENTAPLDGDALANVLIEREFAALAQEVRNGNIRELWLALPISQEPTIHRFVNEFKDDFVNVRFIPDVRSLSLFGQTVVDLLGVPAINIAASPITDVKMLPKLIFDRVFAAVVLMGMAPLLAAIAVAVKMSSPGPVFFKLCRKGIDGRQFEIYKFRSMKVHTEAVGQLTQASRNDKRVTRVGAFLRRTSLDELPQFINVLRGEMSVVGPRPHALQHDDISISPTPPRRCSACNAPAARPSSWSACRRGRRARTWRVSRTTRWPRCRVRRTKRKRSRSINRIASIARHKVSNRLGRIQCGGASSRMATDGRSPIRHMNPSPRAYLLGPLLKSVSRSFYLTLRVLPPAMRDPIGLAYLLARAADTIADTSLIPPPRRLELLLALRAQVNGAPDDAALASIADEVAGQQAQPDERVLLERLRDTLAILPQLSAGDAAAVRDIVTTLTTGMEFDLRTFPDETSGAVVALERAGELDRYTYLVAGCVGEFWTKMTCAHLPGILKAPEATMLTRGVRFGQSLQMTNVLRDCARDLRIGRCYLPSSMLARHGLTPQDLLNPQTSTHARPVLCDALRTTLDLYREAVDYTLAIPAHAVRLRLACLWPIMIGLDTLVLLANNEAWLDPARVSKIRRNDVYRILAASLPLVASNGLVRRWADKRMRAIEAAISA
ncbi:Phytoene synthase [Candidatus Burkholderia verschuerenii]|uniref:Phytoene synthase n=2 Tax=Candidatus Burkholderia verschuerenii TaxID=242163 RepID=A0A0L0MH48_9BURK|nr:Phytoene synthase [Candidatus Burkholderia verschuerenii]